jgi:hypothetical protein
LKISLASRVGEVSALFRKKQSAYLKSMPCAIPRFPAFTLTDIGPPRTA